jgi:hypothetical protein
MGISLDRKLKAHTRLHHTALEQLHAQDLRTHREITCDFSQLTSLLASNALLNAPPGVGELRMHDARVR